MGTRSALIMFVPHYRVQLAAFFPFEQLELRAAKETIRIPDTKIGHQLVAFWRIQDPTYLLRVQDTDPSKTDIR